MEKLAKDWSWLTEEEIMNFCRQEGIEQAFRRIAERMIQDGMSDQAVSDYTNLPMDEVRELRNCHLKPLSLD